MPEDKSLFSHGWIYHRLFDPALAVTRRVVLDLIDPGSSVLDIACGTGELSFLLNRERGCSVVGIDLSHRQIRFAERRNRCRQVKFVHQDATDLRAFGAGSFDYATVLFWMHEIPEEIQAGVLNEALRVADRIVIADSSVPLPRNVQGLGIRAVEASFGREHYRNLSTYLARGGIMGIVKALRPVPAVLYRSHCWHGCREVVMVSRKA